jgi:hypothetical protein
MATPPPSDRLRSFRGDAGLPISCSMRRNCHPSQRDHLPGLLIAQVNAHVEVTLRSYRPRTVYSRPSLAGFEFPRGRDLVIEAKSSPDLRLPAATIPSANPGEQKLVRSGLRRCSVNRYPVDGHASSIVPTDLEVHGMKPDFERAICGSRTRPVCLFLAYFPHQEPASWDQLRQLQATRKSLAEGRISSNQQLQARGSKTQQITSVSAVNRRVVGSSPT